jgi:PKD repeat protein
LIGTGVWSWDPAYSGINVTDLSCNSDVCNVYVTDMIRGTYTFTWTVSNTFNGEYGMPSKTCILDAQIQIESKIVTPNAGDDQYVCSDTTTLSGSILDPLSDPWGTTGQWSVVVSPSAPSPPSFSSATTLVTTNNRNPKVYNLSRTQANTFRWTEWNLDGSCPTSDDMEVYNGLPSDAIILDPATTQQTVCNGSYVLRAQNLSYGNGLWTVNNPVGIIISSNTSLVTNVSGIPQKSNRIFKWTASRTNLNGDVCKDSASVNIYNNGITSDPNNPGTICGTAGGVGYTTLDANGEEPDITGLWTSDPSNPGSSIIGNPTSFTTSVTDLASGEHTFTWTVYRTHNGVECFNSEDLSFLVSIPDSARADVYNPTTLIKGDTVETCDDIVQLQGNLPASIETGSGVWTELYGDPSSTLIIIDNTNNVTTVSGFLNIENYNEHGFVWTIKNKEGCSSSDSIFVLNHGVIANAHLLTGQDVHICSEDYTLRAEDLNAYNSEVAYPIKANGLWSTTSSASIADVTAYDTEVSGLPNGGTINEFTWTVTKGNCTSSDIVNVYNEGFAISAGSPNEACNETTILHGDDPGSGTGVWTALSAGSIVSPSSAITVVDDLILPGDFDFKWTVTRGDCSSSDIVTVTNNTVYANAGNDEPTCNDSVKLIAVEDLTAAGTWTPISASSSTIITSSLTAETIIRNLRPGTSLFRWTLEKGTCTDYDEVQAINNSVKAVATDVTICQLPSQLTASPPTGGATGLWTNLSPSPINFIDGNTLFNTRIDGILEDDIAILKWKVSNSYCSDSTLIMATNNSFDISAGVNDTVCLATANLSAETRLTGSGYWTITPSTGIIANPTSAVTSVSNLKQGDNILRWTYQDNGCTAFDDIIIRNNQIYLSPMAPITTCNTFTTLTGTNVSGGIGNWTYNPYDPSVDIISPDEATTDVEGLKGDYNFHTFTWSVIANGCSASSSVNVTTNFFKADAGSKQTVPTNFTTLDGYLETGATGTWSPIGTTASIAVPTLPNTMVNNLQFGSNLFEWNVDWKGCNSSDTVNIVYNYLNVDAGVDTSICDTRVLLKGSDPSPGTGKWTLISGTGEFTDDTDPRTEVTNIEIGSINWYKWTVSIPGDEISDSVRVINTQFSLSAGLDRDICTDSATLAGQKVAGATGYWEVEYSDGIPVFLPDNSTYNAQVKNLGPGPNIFKWTVSRPLGCTNSAEVKISFNEPPIANFDTDISEGCSPIDVLYANTSSGGTNFTWLFGKDGNVDQVGLDTISRTYKVLDGKDTVHTTTLIAYSSAGCTDTVTKQITVYRAPIVDFIAYPENQIYPDVTVNIDNRSGETYDEYYWDYGDGTNQIDNEYVPADDHAYDNWGTYTITLRAEEGDCQGITSRTINILAPQPKDRSSDNHIGGCNPFAVTLKAQVEYADTFYWKIGNEAELYGENPSYIFDQTGRYYIRLYVGGPGTGGELELDKPFRIDTVDVYPTPFADFNPLPKTVLLPNQPVYCNNLTLDGEYYVWDFGDDSEISTDPDPSHYYTKAGTYNITLTAYTENECYDDTTINEAVTLTFKHRF